MPVGTSIDRLALRPGTPDVERIFEVWWTSKVYGRVLYDRGLGREGSVDKCACPDKWAS